MEHHQELNNRKKQLVEKFGIFMENQEQFSPISARIFASLFINIESGTTFDELVVFLSASKSTISSNLQNLNNMGMVTFYTKPGDRKKYYTLSPLALLKRINDRIERYKIELELIEEIIRFKIESKKIHNNENDKFFIDDDKEPYKDYIKNMIASLEHFHDLITTNCKINSNQINQQ